MTGPIGLFALLATAAFAGAAFYVSIAEHPARMALGDEAALAQWKPSYQRGKAMQASLALLGGALALWAWWQSRDWLWLAGGIALLANWPFTLLAILPTNQRLEAVPPGSAGAETRALLMRWGRLHAGRTLLGMLATALMLAALAVHASS
jgi:threonine dehydrogenase-like Zn-dependent dehydrogenase